MRVGDDMSEGFFRSKKGFTVVQNEITRDATISLKAKGLYLVIQAYITMPDKKWTKDDFLRLAKEGSKAFDSAWKELKESGYLKVHIMSDNGRWRTEYELLDEPEPGPHTLYHNADGEVTSDNIRRAKKKKDSLLDEKQDHYPQNGTNGAKDHYPPFGSNGNGMNGSSSNGDSSNGNGGNNNKYLNINPKDNTYHQYPNHNPYPEEEYSMKFIEEHFELGYAFEKDMDGSHMDTIRDVLYDILNTGKKIIRVLGEDKPASVVKARILKLNRLDIEYAMQQYEKQVTKVKNHKSYLVSILYTAKAQGNLDITNQVMYDFYGEGRIEISGEEDEDG